MKAATGQSLLRVRVANGLRFDFPCDSRGKVNEASLTPAALANWQWVIRNGNKFPIEIEIKTP